MPVTDYIFLLHILTDRDVHNEDRSMDIVLWNYEFPLKVMPPCCKCYLRQKAIPANSIGLLNVYVLLCSVLLGMRKAQRIE